MKKRILFAAGIVAAATLALTGCGASGSGGGGKPHLLLWVDTPRVYAAQDFKKAMAGKMDVTIQTIAQADAQTKIQLANTTKKGWPDVIFGTSADTAQFASPANGYAKDLTSSLPQNIKDGYGADGNNDCTFQGKILCLKNDLAATVLWYNTKVFDQLHLTVPTTMDEFAATALKLKGTGYTAGAIGDQDYYASFLQSSECPLSEVTKENTVRIAPDSDNCTRVATLVQPLLDAGVVDKRSSFDPGFIKQYGVTGKVAMTIGPAWYGDFVIKPTSTWGAPAGQYTAAPMPTWPGAKTNYSGVWGGGVFTVSSHSQYPDAAQQAAIYMATDKTVQANATGFPAYVPDREIWHAQIAKDPYFAKDPYPALADAASKISQVDRPVRFPFVAEVGTTLQAGINGGKSLSASLNDFATGLQNLAPASGYKVVTK